MYSSGRNGQASRCESWLEEPRRLCCGGWWCIRVCTVASEAFMELADKNNAVPFMCRTLIFFFQFCRGF